MHNHYMKRLSHQQLRVVLEVKDGNRDLLIVADLIV